MPQLLTITSGFAKGDTIYPTSQLTWSDLGDSIYSAWSDWTDWNPVPNNIEFSVLADAGSKAAWTPTGIFTADGTITVELEVGDDVDSADQIVTPTTITVTDQGVTYPEGQYFQFNITVEADSTTSFPTTTVPQIAFSDTTVEEILTNVDTSTLSSDSLGGRELPTTIGIATALIVTAQQEGVTYPNGELQDRVYAVPDDYIFQENAIVVNIVSKSPPTIRCFDLNGESIDAVVDAKIVGLPQIQLTPDGVESA